MHIYSIDVHKNAAYKLRVVGVDKKTGEFSFEDLPKGKDVVSLTAPELHEAVCMNYRDYSWANYKFKLWWVNDR